MTHGEETIKNCASHYFIEESRTVHHRGLLPGKRIARVVEYCPNCNYTVEYCSGCTLRRGYYA